MACARALNYAWACVASATDLGRGSDNNVPTTTTRRPAPQPQLALLADADADTRQMYAEYLKLGAWAIDEAEDGREALALAIGHHPDVIVTETRLPGISGYDLCSMLRRDVATRAIPILVVTADAVAENLARAERVGADRVLVKPCLPETLSAEVHALMARSSDLRARSIKVRGTVGDQLSRSQRLLERSAESRRKYALSHALDRHDTLTPPITPPALICPLCDRALAYQRSHIGGVSARHLEQWDYFECAAGCGTFQYRERTRKLRKV